MNKNKLLLFIIIIIAAVLRLWQLGTVPPSPDWDEAALGYNAYSIMQTGKDEYGKLFPLILQSFADFKPALYVYLVIPAIAIFGLDTFAVRLPSAVLGILTVLATYFLVKALFRSVDQKNLQQKHLNISNYADQIALVAAALLAISPWHIQFSRIAFEANIGLAFNVFGVLFFLEGLRRPILLSVSFLSFGLGLHAYQSEKVFIPLLGFALLFIYRKEFFAFAKKYLFAAFMIGFIVASPLLIMITDQQIVARAKGVSIFSAETLYTRLEKEKYIIHKEQNNPLGVIFHNRYITYGREVVTGYLAHFDLKWLFIKGDLERHHAPGMSLLYLWELPFLLVGIYGLLFWKFPKKAKIFLFSWFLLAPIPASITYDIPHAVRTINFLPTFQIFTAIGLVATFVFITKNYESRITNYGIKLFAIGYMLFAIFNFSYYLNQYFVQQNYYYSKFWQYGYKEAIDFVKQNENKYEKIVVASQSPLDQSYIFFLFYLQYPPLEYQHEQDPIDELSGNFEDKHKFGKYEFRPINWDTDKQQGDILLIGRPQDFPKGVSVKEINYLNGEPAILIVGK